MIKSHPNPKLADQILSACPHLADLRDALKANVEAVRARGLALPGNKKLYGFLVSDSVIEDATDNVFYTLEVRQIYGINADANAGSFYAAEVTFKHNASMQGTKIIVQPAAVQLNSNDIKYELCFESNPMFPKHLTHLLYRAIEKIATEYTGDYTLYPHVANLEFTV